MRLEFTEEEQVFREEVRAFLREKLPPSIREKVLNGFELSREDHVLWQRTLHERGWGGGGWPKGFRGPGWKSGQQYLFEEGTSHAGPARPPPLLPQHCAGAAPSVPQRRPTPRIR